jgi:hypothetical protein
MAGSLFADGGLSWRMRVILIVREKSAAYQNGSRRTPLRGSRSSATLALDKNSQFSGLFCIFNIIFRKGKII